MAASGATVDPRRGDSDDPLAGVVHMMLADGTDVDLVVAKWKWEAGVIERAERMAVMGTTLPVPLTSDLILLKLAAGGHLDRRDAAVLLTVGDRETLVREVESRIGDVHPDVKDAWQELRQGP